MIPIAHPLADEKEANIILEELKRIEKPTSGIKACVKKIMDKQEKEAILVLSATTYPMDLISHLPVLCEENDVPYIFVSSNEWIKGFTCVLISAANPSDDMKNVLNKANSIKK